LGVKGNTKQKIKTKKKNIYTQEKKTQKGENDKNLKITRK